MALTLQEVAQIVGGRLQGPPTRRIKAVAPVEEAGPEDATFVTSPRYARKLAQCRAGVVLVRPEQEVPEGLAVVRVEDPYLAFAKLLNALVARPYTPGGIHPSAYIAPSAHIADDATIHPFVYVGEGASIGQRVVLHPGVYVGEGASIGEDTVVYPNAVIYHGCKIGRRCIIHAGTVVGADGYGFVFDGTRHLKIPQIGIVQIDDDVELGALNTVDRAALGRTWIQEGVKTDNMVHVGHNCVVGAHSLLVAQVGISGSTRLGKGVVLGGQVGVAGHLEIGDGAKVGAKSGVTGRVKPGEVVTGYPAIAHRLWLKVSVLLKRLPELFGRVEELEKRVGGGKSQGGEGDE